MNNKRILLGISGGVAAYKASTLVSMLTQQGAEVRVIMTENAMKFVSPLTLQALSRNPVYTDTFDEKDPTKIAHIDLADWAELVIIAPATANIIGKISNGIADDMLSTTMLATQATVYIAPAMNVHMYEHPAVIKNIIQLEKWGYHFIEPGAGYLACGYVGKGRLEEPHTIIDAIVNHQNNNALLSGYKVLISAGPTREMIDPVRYYTNRSSGKMGFALAEAAANLGADVTLVSGPVALEISHPAIKRVDIITADEMDKVIMSHFESNNIFISAAAVADYRPKKIFNEKMKKQPGDLVIEMERTKDILQALGEKKSNQFLVGFAAETINVLENGIGKLKRKGLNAIVINNISSEGAGFEGDTNIVTYVNDEMKKVEFDVASKREIAEKLLMLIYTDIKDENSENC